jgi:hypothetical protein
MNTFNIKGSNFVITLIFFIIVIQGFLAPDQPFLKAYYEFKNDTVALKYVYHKFSNDSFCYAKEFDKMEDSSTVRTDYSSKDVYFQKINFENFKNKTQVLYINKTGNVALIKQEYDRGPRLNPIVLSFVLTSDLHDSLPVNN